MNEDIIICDHCEDEAVTMEITLKGVPKFLCETHATVRPEVYV